MKNFAGRSCCNIFDICFDHFVDTKRYTVKKALIYRRFNSETRSISLYKNKSLDFGKKFKNKLRTKPGLLSYKT